MLLKRKCECGLVISAQRKDVLIEHLKAHQEASTEPEKHRPEMGKDV